jgi:hypothetical protein
MYNAPQTIPIEQFILALTQVQADLGTALFLFHRMDGVFAFAVRLPAGSLVFAQAGTTRGNRDLIGDDKNRIEADAELADEELGILLAIAGQALEKLMGARFGNRSQIIDDLLTGHPDAVIADGNGPLALAVFDLDRELCVPFEQAVVAKRLEPEFFHGIGGVGDQLPQKDLLVAVQGMHHEIQQLLDLGLKAEGLFIDIETHTQSDSEWF